MKTVMFDMDGVLANFVKGFALKAHQLLGIPVRDESEWTGWDDYAGMSKEHVNAVWSDIVKSPNFWSMLPAHVDEAVFARIAQLERAAQVYFVTARHGYKAKEQTEWWLKWHGLGNPTVITTKLKGEFAACAGADFCIDDKAENAWCVSWITKGKTQSYLLSRPYNEHDPIKVGSSKTKRVRAVEEFLDDVEAAL